MVMKLFTESPYNKEAMKQTMRKAWRSVGRVKSRDLNHSIMLVESIDIRDKNHVIREGPWSFDKNLVMFVEGDGCLQVHQIEFKHALFWIHLHDLPLLALTEPMGRRIGASIWRVEEVDAEEGADRCN